MKNKADENPVFITFAYFNVTANGDTLGRDNKK